MVDRLQIQYVVKLFSFAYKSADTYYCLGHELTPDIGSGAGPLAPPLDELMEPFFRLLNGRNVPFFSGLSDLAKYTYHNSIITWGDTVMQWSTRIDTKCAQYKMPTIKIFHHSKNQVHRRSVYCTMMIVHGNRQCIQHVQYIQYCSNEPSEMVHSRFLTATLRAFSKRREEVR